MRPPEPGPVGIMGGTFDPVHLGHLRLAEEARECLGLDHVLWIPAGRPLHRPPPVAAAEHRLAMVGRAISDNPAFVLDDSEVLSTSPSYTVETLERLRRTLGRERPLVLLMGADAFKGLTTWHRWRQLFDLAHLAVATRPGHDLAVGGLESGLAAEFSARVRAAIPASPAGGIATFALTALDVSATAVRELLARGRSPRYLIPERVLDYIDSHSLYR